MAHRMSTTAGFVMLFLSACSTEGDGGAEPSACPLAIQYQGVRYDARVEVTQGGAPAPGEGLVAKCTDVEGQEGLSFPEDGQVVEVTTWKGVAPEEAVVAPDPEGDGSYLYVAETVSDERSAQIERQASRQG